MLHKRFLSLLCCLFLLLPLASCEKAGEGTMTGDSVFSAAPNQPVERKPSQDYLELERRKIGEVVDSFFGFEKDSRALGLPLPKDWRVTGGKQNGYRIQRDGQEIGWLKAGTAELPNGAEVLDSATSNYGALSIEWTLVYDPAEDSDGNCYRNWFDFSYPEDGTERTVTLCVDYTELSEFAVRKLLYSSQLRKRTSDAGFDTLKLKPENDGKPVLILGNSFIGSSDIGTILQDMCYKNGRQVTIEAISVGYATVSKSWAYYLEPMRNGEYAAVLMCGFYGADDVTAFQQYADACKSFGTPIVIFPAHNEGNGDTAIKRYSNTLALDWKGEVNMLISSGVPRAEFCINDQHQHSTPLAGYVGAHMIYRALFGEVPGVQSYYGSLSHTYVESMLGDYMSLGYLVLLQDSEIHMLG